MPAPRPLCFVLMPFGKKESTVGGREIDFDQIYASAIQPAIEAADLEPLRADEELVGGIIHKAMFERLLLCEYAVADLTTGNANVLYELGLRHAVRPATTVSIFASKQKLPFDVVFLRSLPYELGETSQFGSVEAESLRTALGTRLKELRALTHDQVPTDSPLFQLIGDYPAPDLSHLPTDVFRDQVRYAEDLRRTLAKARQDNDSAAVSAVEHSLADFDGLETGVLIDLFLSYRAVEAWDRMVALHAHLPQTLQRTVVVREQLALALNKLDRHAEALQLLDDVVAQQGPTPETCGLVGSVYKDQWRDARNKADAAAPGYLDKAIAAYVRGFEADWRDFYPGINALTLLEVRGDDESLKRKATLLPVVRFAVEQRLKSTKAGYWEHATQLELYVLESDAAGARAALADALASIDEKWKPTTTTQNLQIIQAARVARGIQDPWLADIVRTLEARK
jgi:hypothetical protein